MGFDDDIFTPGPNRAQGPRRAIQVAGYFKGDSVRPTMKLHFLLRIPPESSSSFGLVPFGRSRRVKQKIEVIRPFGLVTGSRRKFYNSQ